MEVTFNYLSSISSVHGITAFVVSQYTRQIISFSQAMKMLDDIRVNLPISDTDECRMKVSYAEDAVSTVRRIHRQRVEEGTER